MLGVKVDTPFIPELDKVVFHLVSSGILDLREIAGRELFLISEQGKTRLAELADARAQAGRLSQAEILASDALAQNLNEEISRLSGEP